MKRILPPHARMNQIRERARRDIETPPETLPVVEPVVEVEPEVVSNVNPLPVEPLLDAESILTPPGLDVLEQDTEPTQDSSVETPVEMPVEAPERAVEPNNEPEPTEEASTPENPSESVSEPDLVDLKGLSVAEIKLHKRLDLDTVATSLGLDPENFKNKTEIAEALYEALNKE
jgi:hypothetical protein